MANCNRLLTCTGFPVRGFKSHRLRHLILKIRYNQEVINIFNFLSLIANSVHDSYRYFKHSSSIYPPRKSAQLKAKITTRYHNLEKGLSLTEIHLGFGKESILELFEYLNNYVKSGYDQSDTTFQAAVSVLNSYITYHERHDFKVDWVKQQLQKYKNTHSDSGGTIELTKDYIIRKELGNFEDLALNRHSIRDFSSEAVPLELIKHAVEIAQRAPSVCNRQSGRAHIIINSDVKNMVLALHKGNRGFGHLADKIIIVTSDIRTFTHVGERNQAYIDGSLFGMSLIYALHSLGLATCALNWSTTYKVDKLMRDVTGIPDYEVIIFLVAVGNYKDTFKVTKSSRIQTDETMRII